MSSGARAPAPLLRAVAAEARARPPARAPAAPAAPGSVSTAMHAIDEGRLVFDAPGRRAVVGRAREQPHVLPSQSIAIARSSVARDVADIAAERDQRLSHGACAGSSHADVVEGGGDRRMRLVHRDAHGRHLRESGRARRRRPRRRRLRPAGSAWRRTSRLATVDDLVVADRVGELVGARAPARGRCRA